MSDFEEMRLALARFRDERDWAQFHNPKDLALALSVEAAELLELFLWNPPEAADPARVQEELADVLLYAFQLADRYGFDLKAIMQAKIARNAEKYPVALARGNARRAADLTSPSSTPNPPSAADGPLHP